MSCATNISSTSSITANDIYYFGYGGNMNREVLKRAFSEYPELMKPKNLSCLGCYRLDNYAFAYNRKAFPDIPTRTGGNIQQKEGSSVYGVVWKITKKAIEILDEEEGAPTVYQRHGLKVVNDQGDVKEVQVYIATSEYIDNECHPRRGYVEEVVQGARDNQLPEKYIQEQLIFNGIFGY